MTVACSRASKPCLSAEESGGPTSGLVRRLIAMPQYAIEQLGSVFVTSRNAFRSWGYQKLCSMARARSNCRCAEGVQEVAKCTCPSLSPFSCPASRGIAENDARMRDRSVRFITRLQDRIQEALKPRAPQADALRAGSVAVVGSPMPTPSRPER